MGCSTGSCGAIGSSGIINPAQLSAYPQPGPGAQFASVTGGALLPAQVGQLAAGSCGAPQSAQVVQSAGCSGGACAPTTVPLTASPQAGKVVQSAGCSGGSCAPTTGSANGSCSGGSCGGGPAAYTSPGGSGGAAAKASGSCGSGGCGGGAPADGQQVQKASCQTGQCPQKNGLFKATMMTVAATELAQLQIDYSLYLS